MQEPPTYADICDAHRRIAPHVHRTPILTCAAIDALVGARLYFKCENFQKSGSFKARGAFNAVLGLDEATAARGVVTHSSGNHGAALALAARGRGVPAVVVVPDTILASKRAAIAAYGAQIRECPPTLAAREAMVTELAAQTGALVVPPFDDRAVAAGQGTVAVELLEDMAVPLDALICPVGGGGLLAGTAIAAAALAPSLSVLAAEPAFADDAAVGFRTGVRQPQRLPVATIADGLTTAMSAMTFEVMQQRVSAVATVSEAGIVEAMRLIWSRLKIVVEPSAAVPLAVLLEGQWQARGKAVGIILSGGNVDLDRLPWPQ